MDRTTSGRPVDDLEHRFAFHPASTEERRRKHSSVRAVLLNAARDIDALVPNGREKSLAITALEESMMWANAGIARAPAALD